MTMIDLKWRWVALAGIVLLALVFLLNIEICLLPSLAPSFSLRKRSGELVQNSEVEAHEQIGVWKHWDSSYKTGLNLGVYIGTSCIFLDKLLERNTLKLKHPESKMTACADFNTNILTTMKENFASNGRSIHLLHGILTDEAHCPQGAKVLKKVQEVEQGGTDAGLSNVLMNWNGMGHNDSFAVDRCYTPEFLKDLYGGSPEVWYMDCDGCLPDFYKQFRSAFTDPGSKLFVYEREPPLDIPVDSLAPVIHWHAKYQDMEQDLRDTGWIAKQCNPTAMWGVWAWQRGGSRYTIHVWLLATWAALIYALSWLTDAFAQRTPFSRWPVPIWRMLVLVLWRYLFEKIFGVLPFNLQEPIIGLDCTWTCSQQNAFALSNFIFIYIAVLWPAVQVSSQPATMFLASIQIPFFLGLGYHLCWHRPENVCQHPGPLRSIWQATVMFTLAMSSYHIFGHSKLQAIPGSDD